APKAATPPRPQPAPPPPRAARMDPPPDEPSTRLLIVLPLMALLLAGAVFALFVWNTQAPKDAIIPSIRGMTRDQAARVLQTRGLAIRVAKESYDEKVAPGTVLLVNPPEGTQVKQGKAVEVWLSKGPEPADVP